MKIGNNFKIITTFTIIAVFLFASLGAQGNVFAQGILIGDNTATSTVTQVPTVLPSTEPTIVPTAAFTDTPTSAPTVEPTILPTEIPSLEPTGQVYIPKGPEATSTATPSTRLPKLPVSLSADGKTLFHGAAPLVVVVDPKQTYQGLKIPDSAKVAAAIAAPESSATNFSVTFAASGTHDLWGASCQFFPSSAQTAFKAAAAIWASTVTTTVPVKIFACWSNIGSSNVLGYSGGANLYRDFSGAKKSGTWYESSLADALHGSDLKSSGDYDDYITFNTQFPWYYGTDGNPTYGTYDMVTVAAHEMGHGLNFSGSAEYSSGSGSFGYGSYPVIYDTFLENSSGKKLTTYANPSTSLGSLLTSNALYFNGTNANAANGGSRVKIYAPSTWSEGSSYSHLDYNTYAGTSNSMMVYALSSGTANHNPGVVTEGMLFDMGWMPFSTTPTVPTTKTPKGTITNVTPTFNWTTIVGATQYTFVLYKGSSTVYTKTVTSSVCGSSTCSSTPTTALSDGSYSWKVRAYVGGFWWSYSSTRAFVVVTTPTLKSPSGTIAANTPTFTWTTIASATQYGLAVLKGSTTVYTKTILVADCGSDSSVCSTTPTTALTAGSNYTWKVHAYVGGVWKTYSSTLSFSPLKSTAFDSEFTSNATGWSVVRGTWTVGSGYYKATESTNYFASSKYSSSSFSTMTYEVSLKRQGDPNAANGVVFNGTPSTSPTSNNGRWNSGYGFYITTNGAFSIWRYDNYVSSALQGWTANGSIKNSGTNVLKVTYNANTGFVQFYINGDRVAYGTLTNYNMGQVGLTYFDSGYSGGDRLYVDYAKVSLTAPSSYVAGLGVDISNAPAIAKGGSGMNAATSDTGNY